MTRTTTGQELQHMSRRVFGQPATHLRTPGGAALCGQVSVSGGPARTGYTAEPGAVTCRKCLKKLPVRA